MTRQTALIICPGRGSYQSAELGYLHKHHSDRHEFIAALDDLRTKLGQDTISDLDRAKRFSLSRHSNGENASLLIYACALADFMAIDRTRYEIVAIAGNSMGWYLTLACAGALSLSNGARLVNQMGTLMHQKGVGGQIIYPLTGEDWRPDQKRIRLVDDIVAKARERGFAVHISIRLGGTIVLAADKDGLAFLTAELPVIGRYPMVLAFHSAFHSPLLTDIIAPAQRLLPQSLFTQPAIAMIDGSATIWSPQACDLAALYHYTIGTQINQTYDFTGSITTALREFAPDKIIILGPGTTMGPPVAQTLIANRWAGITSKQRFKTRQNKDPVILAMGIEAQRQLVV